MTGLIRRYTEWLHTRWPAGKVEKLPEVNADGSTRVPGLYVVGDLTGIPLLKFSADSGARAVRTIAADRRFRKSREEEGDAGPLDLAIIGAGVSGMAAALEAKKEGLSFELLESAVPFSTIVNFPKGKPIYAYPTGMKPAGDLTFSSEVKEPLVEELLDRTVRRGIEPRIARAEKVARKGNLLEVAVAGGKSVLARRVIVAIGRSGDFRKLGAPGEDRPSVYNRLHDPAEFRGKNVVVVGGGDSALEATAALARYGAAVTLSYRKPRFSRPKPENIERLGELAAPKTGEEGRSAAGTVRLLLSSSLKEIGEKEATIETPDAVETIPCDAIFSLIGREAPLDFFRRSGVPIRGEWKRSTWVSFAVIVALFTFVYHWKKSGVFLPVNETFSRNGWFPFHVPDWWAGLGAAFADPSTIAGTMKVTVGEPGFYYSLAYTMVIVLFGVRRIRRRKTPYVKTQTITLMAVQAIPLFLLPYILLPWMGNNGLFDGGALGWFADRFFPVAGYGHGREYWRAFGFILAWPLFFWNVFHHQPLGAWLLVSFVQTFVLIPIAVYYWGKGAYCGWICSCGAMAETLGDSLREKMPHGPVWNRVNMIGQFFLLVAFLLLITRILSWIAPGSPFGAVYETILHGIPALNYVWFVDLFFAGIIGFGFYFHFSGRAWCRFACPLAALMHIYARFSSYRIFSEKKKCISCNVCTVVCHQGIDVMNFANKGVPMEDPECVRCSACVSSCPTGVLSFGRVDRKTGSTISAERIAASPVRMREAAEG